MEKLPHERLREMPYKECQRYADEIERNYIPLPRDPEGKPWNIGEETDKGTIIAIGVHCSTGESTIGILEDRGVMYYPADMLKRPAPRLHDPDGVPFVAHETVWDKATGEALTVVSPLTYTKDGTMVTCKDGCPGELHYRPEDLTHCEPDSLEKLRDDISMYAACEGGSVEIKVEKFADRLTALIERGA